MADFNLKQVLSRLQEKRHLKDLTWTGNFDSYIEVVRQHPTVTRNAFQRMYDMIAAAGTEEYIDFKKTMTHYKFFDDETKQRRETFSNDESSHLFSDVNLFCCNPFNSIKINLLKRRKRS